MSSGQEFIWEAAGPGDGSGGSRVGRGGKRRSETVTVRLDPKLRYLAELAARKQRRTLSSYIEWAIEVSLGQVILTDVDNWSKSISDVASTLWDVDDAERFARLALNYPEMLNHAEQVLWKLICECGYLWTGHYEGPGPKLRFTWYIRQESLIFERLRENWENFNKVARGEANKTSLPGWVKEKSVSNSESDSSGTVTPLDDDDIPF